MTEQVISIDASSERDLANDVVSITLQATKTGATASEVQTVLREDVKAALEQVRPLLKGEEVEVTTDSFEVQPTYTKANKPNGYLGTATITVKGTDTATIAQLASDIKTMAVSKSKNSISRKLRLSVEAELMKEAITEFRTKADDVAEAFGFKYWTLGSVRASVNVSRPSYGGGGKVFAMAAAESAPMEIESGKSTMIGSVSGSIILSKTKPK